MTTNNEKGRTNTVTCVTGATRAAALICVTTVLYSLFDCPLSLRAAQGPPTFRTGTTLVEFTVVALDSKGRPVTDLTKSDVVLSDGGKPRDIAFFRFDGEGSAIAVAPPRRALSPGFVSNRPEYEPELRQNVTAIVMDMINTAPPDQNGARTQLLRYLKALPDNAPVGLFQFTENHLMTMVAPFTTRIELMRDRMASLNAAVRQELVKPGPGGAGGNPIVGGDCASSGSGGPVPGASTPGRGSGGRSDSMAAGMAAFAESEARVLSGANRTIRGVRLDKTVASLEALGNHLAAIPGRKNIVWISGGMPIQLKALVPTNFEPQLRLAARRLANQGISIYPVDAKGGCRALDRGTTEGAYGLDDAPQDVFAALNVMADVTGGRVIKYENDLTKGITAAANDLRGTYTIGFYIGNEADDRWHSMTVTTKRSGVTLRHRQGYLPAARTPPQTLTAEAWTRLAEAPLGSTGIRLNGRPTMGPQQVTLLLQIAAADLYFENRAGATIADLEIAVTEKSGVRATSVRHQPLEVTLNNPQNDQRDEIISSATTWPLNAATTDVRVIVRDRLTGRYGTLDMSLPPNR